MALVVNTNIASMNAQRALAANTNDMKQAMERLSTGKKINSAADDAAGFAIAETMTSQVRGLAMAAKNASDGLGLLKIIENATNDVTDILQRVRELAVQAKSDTNSTADKQRLQDEAEALFAEVTRISDQTQYNGTAYLGDAAASTENTAIQIQVGYKDNETIKLITHNVAAVNLGSDTMKLEDANYVTGLQARQDTMTIGTVADYVGETTIGDGVVHIHLNHTAGVTDVDALVTEITGDALYNQLAFTVASGGASELVISWKDTAHAGESAEFSYTLAAGLQDGVITENTQAFVAGSGSEFLDITHADALKTVTAAIDQVAGFKAAWGADQNRLEYTISNLMNVVEFTSAARSRIQDADFAVEAANLAKAQVLQQTGAAMLAQANAAPQLALQLLK